MSLNITFRSHTLIFRNPAGTSRGVLYEKNARILEVSDDEHPGIVGHGECGPLPGLSWDDISDFDMQLQAVCDLFNSLDLEVFPFNLPIILDQLIPEHLPSVRFGVETALLDLMNGGKRVLFENSFSRGETGILMNGLIWMGTFDQMKQQVQEKIEQGFTTIKLKIGAIDFEEECDILSFIRKNYSKNQLALRVDANGAFTEFDVFNKLEKLAKFDIHSIEQPVGARQPGLMHEVCAKSLIPVALDEELIGIPGYRSKKELLKRLDPAFIVLKPSLLGGFRQTEEWIEIAKILHKGWWITSALESNIGLNAIAQFTASHFNGLPQGLGTGQLYANNFDSPLVQKGENLFLVQNME